MSLWSFIVIKQVDLTLTSILSRTLSNDFLTISFHFLFILFLMFLLAFFIAFLRILFDSSFVSLYMFDVLSAIVSVLLDCSINFISDFTFLCSWLWTVRNLIFLANSIKSFSKTAILLIGGSSF